MRPSPFSSIAQSLALMIVGLILLIFVLMRTYTTIACGSFFLCMGSPLPPFNNSFALQEWLQHFGILLLAISSVIAFILVFLAYSREDWDMISAVRLTAFFFAAQGLAAVGSYVTGYRYEVFHLLSAGLTLAALSILIARVLFTQNDEYRQETYLAFLGLIALVSIVPYVLRFA
jgi:hypothetical protein